MMYFDPLSAWLVTLIADGIVISEEKFGGKSTLKQYDIDKVIQGNKILNSDIRSLKHKYGLNFPETVYKKIELRIKNTKNSLSFQRLNEQIILDLDNQEYIILLLEACAKQYSRNSPVEEHKRKYELSSENAIELPRELISPYFFVKSSYSLLRISCCCFIA